MEVTVVLSPAHAMACVWHSSGRSTAPGSASHSYRMSDLLCTSRVQGHTGHYRMLCLWVPPKCDWKGAGFSSLPPTRCCVRPRISYCAAHALPETSPSHHIHKCTLYLTKTPPTMCCCLLPSKKWGKTFQKGLSQNAPERTYTDICNRILLEWM